MRLGQHNPLVSMTVLMFGGESCKALTFFLSKVLMVVFSFKGSCISLCCMGFNLEGSLLFYFLPSRLNSLIP